MSAEAASGAVLAVPALSVINKGHADQMKEVSKRRKDAWIENGIQKCVRLKLMAKNARERLGRSFNDLFTAADATHQACKKYTYVRVPSVMQCQNLARAAGSTWAGLLVHDQEGKSPTKLASGDVITYVTKKGSPSQHGTVICVVKKDATSQCPRVVVRSPDNLLKFKEIAVTNISKVEPGHVNDKIVQAHDEFIASKAPSRNSRRGQELAEKRTRRELGALESQVASLLQKVDRLEQEKKAASKRHRDETASLKSQLQASRREVASLNKQLRKSQDAAQQKAQRSGQSGNEIKELMEWVCCSLLK